MKNLKIEINELGSFGCNCSIIYSEITKEAIIIDPGNDASELIKIITRLGVTPKVLLHTHAHFDHIGESNIIKEKYNVPMALHPDDLFLYNSLKEQGSWFGMKLKDPGIVDIHLNDQDTFGFESDDLKNLLKTIHTPGHTPGSCCFHGNELNLLFSGDTLFNGSIGRTDLPGGDFNLILKSIKTKLFTLNDDVIVVPGHGPNTTIGKEKKSNPFVGENARPF